jgi:hypothetical protein
MKPIKTFKLANNHKLEIFQDTDAESPREWDNLGTMVCWHSRYNLGDDHNFSSPQDFQEWLKENDPDAVILPLYLYDHSGITMSTGPFGCRWDSGQVGWIYVTLAKIQAEYGTTSPEQIEKVKEYLKGEVETYDQFLRGDVYGFVLSKAEHCETCDHEEWKNEESCWGFYGDDPFENGIADHLDEDIRKQLQS